VKTATCPHAPACVPCPYRGLPYREQLARKLARVRAALADRPSLGDAPIDDVVGSRDLFGYRNNVKLAVRSRRGELVAGVYAPGTHRLVDAARCAAEHPALRDVVIATLEEATALGIDAYDERDGSGELRYLVARYGGWRRRVQLALVTATTELSRMRALTRKLERRVGSLGGVVHNWNAESGNVILGRRWSTLRPPAELIERIGFVELQIHAGSFLQSNVWTARRIYETALEWAAPEAHEIVADLFCGVGPLSFYLASRAARVIGIEESPSAVRDARANQRRNRLHNLKFVEGAVDERLAPIVAEQKRVDLVTLNPTRKGASTATIDTIVRAAPSRIVYVSCDPATLARDLDRLATAGYATVRVRPFDMLPQTEHVEVVALAVRSSATAARATP
jgi:23S rRNA (uracil1939-C5)-methyltransferase